MSPSDLKKYLLTFVVDYEVGIKKFIRRTLLNEIYPNFEEDLHFGYYQSYQKGV